jgi:hypothetical protein
MEELTSVTVMTTAGRLITIAVTGTFKKNWVK